MSELSLKLHVHGKHTFMFVGLFLTQTVGLFGLDFGRQNGNNVYGGIWEAVGPGRLNTTSKDQSFPPPSSPGTLLLGSCARCVCGCLSFAGLFVSSGSQVCNDWCVLVFNCHYMSNLNA